MRTNRPVTVKELARFIGKECKILGNKGQCVFSAGSIDEASYGVLTFCKKSNEEGYDSIQDTKASVIICHKDIAKYVRPRFKKKTLLLVDNPRLWFIRCLKKFFSIIPNFEINKTAIIGKGCRFPKEVYIGPYVTIGNSVSIGKNTIIHAGVRIYDNVRIGKNVIINSGAIIGVDGFGFERDENGTLEKFPHFGGVIIGDGVEILSNTCIERGTFSDTVIGKGTKIDNLVLVGHNSFIGKYCLIAGSTFIGGSVRIGDFSFIGGAASIKNGVTIGKKALVGMGAVVTKDVNDSDVVIGVPARSKIAFNQSS